LTNTVSHSKFLIGGWHCAGWMNSREDWLPLTSPAGR